MGQKSAAGGCPGKLVSPGRRRACVLHLRQRYQLSERRACQILGQPRSTQRYSIREAVESPIGQRRVLQLSVLYPSFGYRRIWKILKREGIALSPKAVQRILKLKADPDI